MPKGPQWDPIQETNRCILFFTGFIVLSRDFLNFPYVDSKPSTELMIASRRDSPRGYREITMLRARAKFCPTRVLAAKNKEWLQKKVIHKTTQKLANFHFLYAQPEWRETKLIRSPPLIDAIDVVLVDNNSWGEKRRLLKDNKQERAVGREKRRRRRRRQRGQTDERKGRSDPSHIRRWAIERFWGTHIIRRLSND